MQYDVETASEYLSILEDDWRKKTLLEIRKIIFEKAPEIEESIQYKMLLFGGEHGDLFQLNAQKKYVSLYVGDIKKIDESGELLKGLNLGKGCIRFSKSVTVSNTRIDEFIERTVDLWRIGEDTSC